jgi:tripartite-type tricarboxylate transporter receptor subunit TctC
LVLLCVVLVAATTPVLAQQYPTRAVRIVVPTSTASGPDFAARLLSQPLSERLGQQVVVDNRTGGATMIGTEVVAKAAPDGYTLAMVPPAFAINSSLYKKMPYDALRDFVPITHVSNSPLILVVHPSVPAKSVKELIAIAKARPSEIVFGSSGAGSITHMSMELVLYLSGTRMLHVAYKGPAPGVIDLAAGRVSTMMTGTVIGGPHVRTGRLRALGVSGARRTAPMPDLPTIAEAGVPGYESWSWTGLLAPAGTPQEIIARLSKEATAILRSQDMRERFAKEDYELIASTPEGFAAYIRTKLAKWAKVVKAAGIKAE